ncbi:Smr/MutS family protein [Chitinimonas sp.]|uniref:Smr/MutS family protein n=1 Tax=Chitinimonas sp. TaxID=1934313 RepID=UPI0035B22EE3
MSRPKTPLAELLKPLARSLRESRRQPPPATPAPPPEDDHSVFMRAVAGTEPLNHPLPYPHPPAEQSPHPRQRQRDEGLVMHDAMTDRWPWDEIESGEELLYLRAGQKLDTLKKLRRGHWVVQAQLDLHGLNTDEARAAVGGFLHRCVQADQRCVRIIHGKGLGSRNKEPVLKNKLRNWLVQRDEVLAFCQARPVDGGAGAAIVLLRGRRGA